ncbi:MAG: NAD(P)-dependent alcohol dehydrogenase [Thermoplasmata archaeon]|nr:NAD(P)-dependent alcohol dehydrogenase [Thermoplasmata archaeon]
MKAIVWTEYGPPEVLQLQDVAKPVPRKNELLIRVRATTVAAGDCELRGLHLSIGMRWLVRLLFGLTRPRRKVLGQEFAGEVEAVGRDVRRIRVGDRVFGTTGFGFGAYAEYLCLPADSRGRAIAIQPQNMTYEEAASVPTGGLEALHFLRRAGDLKRARVLINGAGGGIGTFAVQLAKHYGAEVTGVDRTGKLEGLRSIGADRVIDCTTEDFTELGRSYDVIFDVVGTSSYSESMAALTEGGRYLLGNPDLSTRLRAFWPLGRAGKKVIVGTSPQASEDLDFLKQLIEDGKIHAVIDRRFPMDRTAEAHRYFETGVVVGKVVIQVAVAGRISPIPEPSSGSGQGPLVGIRSSDRA